jgi:small-conductance mechanosensitive channel
MAESPRPRAVLLSNWLHLLDQKETGGIEDSSVLAFGPQVPGDFARIFKSAGGENGALGLLNVIFRSILSICVGLFFVFAVKRMARKGVVQFEQIGLPGDDSLARLWVGILRSLPSVAGLLLLAIVSTIVFLFVDGDITAEGRMVFQFIFGTLLIVQASLICGKIIFAPEDAGIRPVQFREVLVKPLYRAFVTAVVAIISGKLFMYLVRDLGALDQTISWVAIILASLVIGVFAVLILYLRKPVSDSLQAGVDPENSGWFKGQLAAYWHVPTLLYLFVSWFVFLGKEMSDSTVRNGSFIISLLLVPIYFILSYMGQFIIISIVDSLGLGTQSKSDVKNITVETMDDEEIEARKKVIVEKASIVLRLLIAAALITWILSLWGYSIPFAVQGVRAIFNSFIVLALALTFWRFASSYIERKIEEATPEVAENEKDIDDEFGGGGPTGRSHTLLPMLRKVIGSILVVFVILTVLSSLGVNIAPLLAGAGVLGLAVGFGAQKLVSDVLSGFFFLLDDAFRVGEYIQTGSIRGTVETITLRNVMLRHHLGMLQVVPHSDLGAVTNYMRGGIVIKFPLEFPYDTDIDKVRKIIKKVGQAMLADEELGDDFILPVKSQGVHQITNSVMVIRVKFTAKPGKQFVIKREAFRRITEALNAKGIYYAHRKVIVDFPADHPEARVDQETRTKMIEAGAAAALAAEADQQKKAEKKQDDW